MNQFNSLRGIVLFLFLFLSHFVWAQNTEQKLKEDKTVGGYTINAVLKTPSSITFRQDAQVPYSNAVSTIQNLFGLTAASELKSIGVTEGKGGLSVERFKQYFRGIKVEHSAYAVVSKNGKIAFITAESYPLGDAFTVNPQLSADAAKGKALDFVRAEKYAWDAIEEDKRLFPNNPQIQTQLEQLKQTYLPKGELVIAKDVYGSKQARLAYKFDVFAVEPIGRYIIYVDAATGRILLRDAVIKHADKIKNKKPAGLRYIPNYQYYGLGYINHAKKSSPFRTSASVPGTGQTRYAGTRQFYTTRITVPATGMPDPNNPTVPLTFSGIDPRVPVLGQSIYILKDDTRGGGIETYDCNNVGGVPLSLPQIQAQATAFVDKDNNWKNEADNGLVTQEDLMRGATADGTNGANEAFNDDIAIDAHWGAGVVYDYWKNIHNRQSYDNKNSAIKSYVHYGPAYDNAFWNGSSMTYGDGSGTSVNGGFKPLTSLDVCGHEIGHGVCSFTSDLVYESESGAMNEGLSDIWAAAVERYAKLNVDPSLNYQYFQIGEQISADNIGLRRMDNPKAKTDPDTYGGRYWQNPDCVPTLANDQCGVHTNSGVLNKWFYLMVQGPNTTTGSPAYTDDGIADKPRTTPAGTDWIENAGNNYGALTNFIGIGFDKAEQITYLMELALTPNAKFAEARAASINAARVLYGPCSQEEITVTNAWYGVNVGAAWSTCTAPTLSVNLQAVTLKEGSGDCGSYTEYTIGVSLSAAQPSATTINFTTPSGTAEPHDYQLTATSVTYNAGEMGNRTIRLRVFNDDMVEGDETINLTATSTLGAFNFNQTLTILDDDVMPRLGNTFTIFSENFETTADDALPAGWDTVNRTNPTGALWNVRSQQLSTLQWTTKRAYIYNPNLPLNPKAQPLYDPTVASQVILHTSLIDARGLDSIRLRFIWSAGGEGACSPACDYGEVVYSLDGVNFNRFDTDTTGTSASEPLYLSPTDSTYDRILPQVVSNRQFYLGFRWVNDDLVTMSPNSITIDNIVVTGQGKKIETDSASGVITPVRVEPGNPVFFYSEDDKNLMSSIINASADLGCVKDTLIQTGNGVVPYSGGTRTRKVFEITPSQNSNATYTLTLYFTTQEVAGFAAAPSQLRILKSNAANIDQSTASNSIIVVPEFIDSSAQGFYGYRYTFTGFSKFALVEASASPLPVNCLDFRAIKAPNAVNLNWRVSDERNNSHFEIERSTDGVNFSKIGEVRASSTNNGQYSYSDNAIGGLRNAYYRLKQVDVTGEFKYLCTVLYVSLDGKNVFTVGNIYPNPGSNNAVVNITTSEKRRIRVEYVNMAGQVLNWHTEQLPAGTTRVALKVNAFAAGSYLVQFKDEENRIVNTQQYFKQ
jgi:Zn-dependent metalloprotease